MTDASRHFFPIAFMVTSHEESIDYERFFISLKALIHQQLDSTFEPRYIMADGAGAIHRAIKSVYPDCQKIMCYFHTMYNVIID